MHSFLLLPNNKLLVSNWNVDVDELKRNNEQADAPNSSQAKGADFVDSSHASILLDLLRNNKDTRPDNPAADSDPFGIENSISKIAANLQSIAVIMAGTRNKVSTNSFAIFDNDKKDPNVEQSSFVKSITNDDGPQFFFSMANRDLRILLDLAMGGNTNPEKRDDSVLHSSEVQFLCMFAEKFAQQVYTARDHIENFPLPGRIVSSNIDDVIDFTETEVQLVCVDLSISFAVCELQVRILVPIEYLQTVSPRSVQQNETDEFTDTSEKKSAKVRADRVPISTSCELYDTEMTIAEIRNLQVGEMLIANASLSNAKLIDADGNCILTGRLSLAKRRLTLSSINKNGEEEHG